MNDPDTSHAPDTGWFDPRHWKLPSPLLCCWAVLVAVAGAATWLTVRQPWPTGLPILLLVLFSELLLALCLLAARARSMFWELRGLGEKMRQDVEALGRQVAAIKTAAASREPTKEPPAKPPLDRETLVEVTSRIREDMASLELLLRESTARIRYDIEDGNILLADLLGGPDGTPGPVAVNHARVMDGSDEE